VTDGGTGRLSSVVVVEALSAARENGGALGFVQVYVRAEDAAGLLAAVVVGAVYAPTENRVALEAPALILEPVLGPAARAFDIHLEATPLLAWSQDRYACQWWKERETQD
jgi:hypothetical protein